MDLVDRLHRVLTDAKYLSLSTVSPDRRPWTAVLQYAWLPDPLRLLFGSATQSRHSRHVAARPTVSGALFVTGDGALTEVDGAQFTGTCRELTADETHAHHATFYDALLPDEASRAEYTLPVSALLPPAEHRIYQVSVDRVWLVDTSTWLEDRIDRRIEVDLP
ncbi:pyridoxamine 5'-phosphate oxidase family protein [Micromonospora sp. C31]|uniref:pyridoxamine 5'-phosphate oxidase family protein n=1 Tax=Micromonospora sp. C31 TaxID=2824876 RepID=UPI001B35EA2D|nr:pyridoxamine 5'-phosphate oxidase family protein [Micromonospora sp. C31]MBQ1074789.1 pyridoxamine 5'-phosphate oxidase family protein [Micromonospora sp. C31]